jgi:DNA repair protein RadD
MSGSTLTLHPFQHTAVEQIEAAVAAGIRRILLVCPTGGGKTVIASDLIKRWVAQYMASLFVAHRREIIQQTSSKLHGNGVAHGIIMAGADKNLRPQEMVQVASIDTLRARSLNSTAHRLPPAKIIWIDEAHHARARTYERLIEAYPDAIIIGLTATPVRGDGRGLGNVFETIIECPQVAELIGLGFLVRARVYAPVIPDLRGVRTRTGDYVIDQLARRMNTDQLVGDIVEHWLKHSERRRTVAFACDVAHSVHIRNEMLAADIRAEHLDANTPIKEREWILARLASGETEVVTNCQVLSEGWDCPPVGCVILARPTKQMGLYRQMIGRTLRPYEGKSDCIVLDHSGACYRHGLPEDPIEWTLDVDQRAANPVHDRRKRDAEHRLRECPSCKALMAIPPCAACGWFPEPKARNIDFEEGELGLVVNGKARAQQYTNEQKITWHQMLIGEALRRGKNPNWAFYLFRDKFGHDRPAYWDRTALIPSPEVSNFVKSRIIAFAKSRSPA